MPHPTTPNPDATIATGTIHLDVTSLAELVARLVIRGLVAHAAADDLDDRNGPYIPNLWLDRLAALIFR